MPVRRGCTSMGFSEAQGDPAPTRPAFSGKVHRIGPRGLKFDRGDLAILQVASRQMVEERAMADDGNQAFRTGR